MGSTICPRPIFWKALFKDQISAAPVMINKLQKVNIMSEKLSKERLKEVLTAKQYEVTQEGGTEPAFNNEYWDSKKEGIYVDVVSGEPLFSSIDKYDSGTGWPSYSRPIDSNNIVAKKESGLMGRVEVRSKDSDSHLGHVFGDGPPDTGKRYCMNSASLRFVPKEDLEEQGYSQFKDLFEKDNKG